MSKWQNFSDTEEIDSLAVESQNAGAEVATLVGAPYDSLPQSYQNILPASLYATHTFVPKIQNYYTKPAA